MPPIEADEVHRWVLNHDDLMIIDVRDGSEFETRHIRGSYHVPLHLLKEHTEEFAAQMASRVVLVCQSGRRAEEARKNLDAAGLTDARVLTGGVASYAAAGGDIVTGRSTWAMDRQIRMTAGSLVLASVLAGRFIHPRFRLLAGVIGAGLTVSAATNSCTLGRILSWMPWNRPVSEPTKSDVLAQLAPHA
ncbi:rhodanese-like domain-containing protein [Cryobacterium sp. Y82]|uniref:rhodanese-like domain-containing protein n=1 Tax=Cryobacterium sp. Y82 TaxID=2045017 RepID=UPI0021006947|nr:rhodanese-like domain-containing protein [Cryobacterium sp. Y82]